MPTVIDSFVLELGLDPSKFTAGQQEAMQNLRNFQEAAKSGGDAVEAQGKRVSETLSSFRREALLTLGLFFGGREAGEFVNWITKMDASTGRLAYTMNMSAQAVSDWQGAFEQVGGTAEGANSALSGLSSEMNRFQLTGQSAMLPVLSRLNISLHDGNGHLKTAGELWLDIADAVHGMDPAQATAFLQMIPGANQDMINFALMGRRAMEQFLSDADKARRLTQQNVEASKEWVKEMGLLERAAISFGEKLVMAFLPLSMLKGFADLLAKWNVSPSTPEGQAIVASGHADTVARFGTPQSADEWLRSVLGGSGEGPFSLLQGWLGGGDSHAGRAAFASRLRSQGGSHDAFIRKTATELGISPDQASAIFGGEGRGGYVGDHGSSFGDFQLHYGGMASGGNAGPGLGEQFTKETGLDARDPSTWQAQDRWSLQYARQHGWGPWHSWKGAPFAGIGGGGRSGGTTINVTGTTINTQATDGAGVARDFDAHIGRSVTAAKANTGAQ